MSNPTGPITQPWWQTTTIYQIYPRSFMDSNGDGIGDLRGIIAQLDYIKDLGFETVWLSPIFSSPQQDWGYDISDFYAIAPEYGDLADAEALISEVHRRGMRILFDLVLNHTSIRHPWFQESRSSRDNPKRDWYIWKDGRGQRPPNNWKAIPGGPAWHYDETTAQWFYTSFLPFQPDLNFRNPAVKEAMFEVVRFWLDKGVDGFRLDIFHAIYKDETFRNNPFSLTYIPADCEAGFFQQWQYNVNRPETFALAKELRKVVDSYSSEHALLGEVFGSDDTVKQYLGDRQDGLNLVFLWELLHLKVDADFFRQVIRHYETRYPVPCTPVYVFGNHDQKRVLSKIGNDTRIAKLLALFQFTARGVPVTYYGEEIGMVDGNFPAKTAKDPLGRRYSRILQFLVNLLNLYVNRDACRTPMQWDDSAHAGFCPGAATPWLPVNADYPLTNVKTEQGDEASLLNVYRKLLHLRQGNTTLQQGSLQLVDGPENLLAYTRHDDEEVILILINFGETAVTFPNRAKCQQVLFQVGMDQPVNLDSIQLPAYSGIILV